MPRKSKAQKDYEYELGRIEVKINEAFYAVLRNNELVNADMVFDEAVKQNAPVKEIAKFLPRLFKRFRKAGLIVKSDRYQLSERSSKPIPSYLSLLHKMDVSK